MIDGLTNLRLTVATVRLHGCRSEVEYRLGRLMLLLAQLPVVICIG